MAAFCTDQQIIDYSESLRGRFSETLFYQQENATTHYSFITESEEMRYIENGDRDGFLQFIKTDFHGQLPPITDDFLLNTKYLAIINIALTSRAAIRGGLPDDQAFALADLCYRTLDALTEQTLSGAYAMIRGMQLAFLNLVAEQKNPNKASSQSIHVIKAKNYIFSHLHEKISLEEIADFVGLHPYYLNSLFKEEEGFPMHAYILREKVNLAKNLLTYSDYSFIDIANYLGFSSQSHLANAFKKYTGQTLKQFRDDRKREPSASADDSLS